MILPSSGILQSRRLLVALTGCVLVGAAPARAGEPLPAKVQFNRDIRPILSDTCFACHGPDKAKRKADLRLDTKEGAFDDRGGYFALVPGKPDDSELYLRITAKHPARHMPPPKSGRKLTERQVALLKRWIEQGAKWEQHWSLIPPKRPALPEVTNKGWPRNPIDHFILARLEKEGLSPSPKADKTTLIRRVTLDLTGLPPTPAEVDAFVNDQSPDAYEKLVDRLLASPRYGERMVIPWLDAARYADSNGYQGDRTRTMWPWRDWVVRALNANMPFDQFTIEQLAGDLLPNATIDQRIASGFNRNHVLNGEGGRIAEESRVDYVVDRVNTTSTVWLGLTVACCQCHDHKYDPLSQKEYYRLFAYFNNIDETGAVDRRGNANPVLPLPTPEQSARIAKLEKKIADAAKRLKDLASTYVPDPAQRRRQVLAGLLPAPADAVFLVPERVLSAAAQRQAAQNQLTTVRRGVLEVMVMREKSPPRETFVLERGAYNKYGEKVTPGVPASLPPLPKDAPPNRLALARWLVSGDNPLTARVTVNRYWQLFFGTGLVKTTEDFGTQGEPPSHPDLLDWLATEFVHPLTLPSPPGGEGRVRGWNVKAMHRLIVTSATYRQSSRVTPLLLERDPDNRLLARGPRKRLSSLLIRDQALAVSGLLVERIGGPPVYPYQPPGIWEEMSFGKIRYKRSKGADLYRRSVYTFWRRTVGPTNLFDTSLRQVCTVRQTRTNTPLHALTLWNDITYVEAARALAERVMKEGGDTPKERITLLFRLATARRPADAERNILLRRLEQLRKHYRGDRAAALKLVGVGESQPDPMLDVAELAAYSALAGLVLNLDEVITRE